MSETTPSLEGALGESAGALLKRLEWTVLRRLDGVLQGDHRTLMRGAGLDLDQRHRQPSVAHGLRRHGSPHA